MVAVGTERSRARARARAILADRMRKEKKHSGYQMDFLSSTIGISIVLWSRTRPED